MELSEGQIWDPVKGVADLDEFARYASDLEQRISAMKMGREAQVDKSKRYLGYAGLCFLLFMATFLGAGLYGYFEDVKVWGKVLYFVRSYFSIFLGVFGFGVIFFLLFSFIIKMTARSTVYEYIKLKAAQRNGWFYKKEKASFADFLHNFDQKSMGEKLKKYKDGKYVLDGYAEQFLEKYLGDPAKRAKGTRVIEEMFLGAFDGRPFCFCSYKYRIGSGKSSRTVGNWVVLIKYMNEDEKGMVGEYKLEDSEYGKYLRGHKGIIAEEAYGANFIWLRNFVMKKVKSFKEGRDLESEDVENAEKFIKDVVGRVMKAVA